MFGYLSAGKGIAHPGDGFLDLRRQFQQPEHLVDPSPGNPEFPCQGGLGGIFPAFKHLFPLPSEANRVPVGPPRLFLLRENEPAKSS